MKRMNVLPLIKGSAGLRLSVMMCLAAGLMFLSSCSRESLQVLNSAKLDYQQAYVQPQQQMNTAHSAQVASSPQEVAVPSPEKAESTDIALAQRVSSKKHPHAVSHFMNKTGNFVLAQAGNHLPVVASVTHKVQRKLKTQMDADLKTAILFIIIGLLIALLGSLFGSIIGDLIGRVFILVGVIFIVIGFIFLLLALLDE